MNPIEILKTLATIERLLAASQEIARLYRETIEVARQEGREVTNDEMDALVAKRNEAVATLLSI